MRETRSLILRYGVCLIENELTTQLFSSYEKAIFPAQIKSVLFAERLRLSRVKNQGFQVAEVTVHLAEE